MLLFAAAILAASTPMEGARPASTAVAEARATVRIISGTRIRFDAAGDGNLPRLRQAHIRTAEGLQPAQLIEFQ